jgi:glutathione S-transferase
MTETITLYSNATFTSPYVLSVFVTLEEKGLPFEMRLVDLDKQEHLSAAYVASSVTNRVPTLAHGDFFLSESSAIDEYLEDVFPPPRYARMYPENVQQRARVRMVQALLRSDFMPIREERSMDTVFLGVAPQPLSVTAQRAVDRLYRIASEVLGDRQSVADAFSIADVDLSVMLQRLLSNGDPIPQRLADYARKTWRRPSIRKWLAKTQYVERA